MRKIILFSASIESLHEKSKGFFSFICNLKYIILQVDSVLILLISKMYCNIQSIAPRIFYLLMEYCQLHIRQCTNLKANQA